MNDLKVRPSLKTQRESPVFKKMLLQKPMKLFGQNHLFFVFAADEAFGTIIQTGITYKKISL